MTNSKANRQNPQEPASELRLEQIHARLEAETRRHFLRSFTAGLGTMFLGTLASPLLSSSMAGETDIDGTRRLDFVRDPKSPLAALPPQFAPRAKRVIYLHMAGAPSQLELF